MKAVLAECCHLFINRLSDQVFVSINIKCKGPDELPLREIGEAPVADLLGDILDNENPTVATYAKEDGVLIRVTASGKTREDALTAMQPVVTKIAEILAGKIAWVKAVSYTHLDVYKRQQERWLKKQQRDLSCSVV